MTELFMIAGVAYVIYAGIKQPTEEQCAIHGISFCVVLFVIWLLVG